LGANQGWCKPVWNPQVFDSEIPTIIREDQSLCVLQAHQTLPLEVSDRVHVIPARQVFATLSGNVALYNNLSILRGRLSGDYLLEM
jgi:hypothetical protein